MFHFGKEKVENNEYKQTPESFEEKGNSGWIGIPFRDQNEEPSIENNSRNERKDPWVKIPIKRYGDSKEPDSQKDPRNPWLDIPFQTIIEGDIKSSKSEQNDLLQILVVEPNSTYEINDHTYQTDDNGNIYNVDGKNLPNCKYELNGYKYETDEKGRIIRAEGDLELPPYQPRPKSLPDIEDRRTEEDERGRDDKGHLIAHEFGGADTEGNLVPMNYEVNEYGEFRKLERELKNAKEEGHDVHVTVEPQYDDDSNRPSSFAVSYIIDGDKYEKVIVNEAKSGEN